MDRTDPAAVGIGAEADVKHLSYSPAQCAGDHTLATCRAALRVAALTQGACSSIHIKSSAKRGKTMPKKTTLIWEIYFDRTLVILVRSAVLSANGATSKSVINEHGLCSHWHRCDAMAQHSPWW